MITLKLSHPSDRNLTTLIPEAARLAAGLTARILDKDPKVTSVAVEVVSSTHWFVAGESLADQRLASFFLEVRISEGTNTKQQKEAFVAQAFAEFRELLGELHNESYVHVIDARSDAYGYGGRTQERRFIENRSPLGAPPQQLLASVRGATLRTDVQRAVRG